MHTRRREGKFSEYYKWMQYVNILLNFEKVRWTILAKLTALIGIGKYSWMCQTRRLSLRNKRWLRQWREWSVVLEGEGGGKVGRKEAAISASDVAVCEILNFWYLVSLPSRFVSFPFVPFPLASPPRLFHVTLFFRFILHR